MKGLEKTHDPKQLKFSIVHRCATDFEMFVQTFLTSYCTLPFGNFQTLWMQDYVFAERGQRKIYVCPRGYAKSTISMFRVLHSICYGTENYIIVASNTQTQAVQKIKDIRTELLDNPKINSVFGPFTNRKVMGSQEMVLDHPQMEQEIKLQSVSSQKEIRGFRFKEYRPTMIILDDFESSFEVETEAGREKYEYIFQDVFSKLGTKHTNIEIVGTILHQRSLLKKLTLNPSYRSRIFASIVNWSEKEDLWDEWTRIYSDVDNENRLSDSIKYYEKNKSELLKGAKVLWPEHETYLDLMKEIVETGRRSFFKEKMNDPLGDQDKIFDVPSFHYFTEEKDCFVMERTGKRIDKNTLMPLMAVDPSTGGKGQENNRGKKKKADFSCILLGYFEPRTERLFVYKDITKRLPPSFLIQEIFRHHSKHSSEQIGIESNLYRGLLIDNIHRERERILDKYERDHGHRQLPKLPIIDIYNSESKKGRIYTLEPKIEHGKIVFNRKISQEFFYQMSEFPKGDHDDCPDTLEMLFGLTHKNYPIQSLSV